MIIPTVTSALQKMDSMNREKRRNQRRHWNELGEGGGGGISAKTKRMCRNEVMS